MFHVPEGARWLDAPDPWNSDSSFGNNGVFRMPSPEPGWSLLLIASDQEGWEHVSVHARNHRQQMRTPIWREMAFVKDTFWDGDDVVMQLHPARSEYVNLHPHTLHLWRPTAATIPVPPKEMVG